jgi:hypothetical protein
MPYMTSGKRYLQDLRRARGQIWNLAELLRHFPVGGADAPWRNDPASSDAWIDRLVYEGYVHHGEAFVNAIKGRFAVVYYDESLERLFIARDWIGELPLHLLATDTCVYVSNTIDAIHAAAGKSYTYAYVRAFPHAHAQLIDLSEIDPANLGLTMRPLEPVLFTDFAALVRNATFEFGYDLDRAFANYVRGLLTSSIARRAREQHGPHAVLLSGGLDSFSVALTLKTLDIPFDAYTLTVEGGGDDVALAAEFAKCLGVNHHLIRVSPEDVIQVYEQAVRASEAYAVYNVYCAVGMVLVADHLSRLGVTSAFCGEAVNEALGDYTSWQVADRTSGELVTLQNINSARLQRTDARQLLVWGPPRDRGRYNRQLGAGLAKHAGSRMIKPFLSRGLTLECPYYDAQLLAHLVAIQPDALADVGGKPGLVALLFDEDLRRYSIERSLIESCKKVRLQDASDNGRGGITSVLLSAGFNQRRTVELFNAVFGAALNPDVEASRLAAAVATIPSRDANATE